MSQILCFGASIVQGYMDPVGGWTQRLRRVLDAKYTTTYRDVVLPSHDVFNLGISGDTTAGLLQRIEQEIIPRKLDEIAAIIISIGVNDSVFELGTSRFTSTPEEYQKNLMNIFSIAHKHTDQVLFLGLTPCDELKTQPIAWSDSQESYSNERIRLFNAVAQTACEAAGVTFVELFSLIITDLIADGIHPTGDGHQLIAEQVLKHLRLDPVELG